MDSNVAELEKAMNQEPSASPQPEPERQGTTSRWADPKFRRAALGALVVLAVVTVALILYYRNRVGTDDAQVDGHIIPIAAKIYGDISEVQVLDNQAVKAGQVLVRIDPRDYQARADQAKAALALAESQSKAAEVGVPMTQETTQSYTSSADAQLASAQAEYDRAKSAYQKDSTAELEFARANVDARQADSDRAQADLARMKPLVEKAEISQLQFDAYRAAARVSESTLAAAKDQLAAAERGAEISKDAMLAAKAKVDIARAGIQQARANNRQVPIKQADAAAAVAAVAQAKANLEAAELQLSYATVVAPMDSVVTKKSVEVGQIVQPGQSLMVLIPLQDVWVTANFKETQLEKVRPGQKAEIHVDMYGETFTGHVDSIAGATGAKLSLLPPENATGNFVKVVERIPVKILVDPVPPDKAILRPGMNVDATIITK
ncbi:Secretion protein HlyD family protein [Acidobacteriia bacterium SbA2]|nr:Secretion protein HlyD family protein [Acidobacteriia bacterium SbA2]